MVERKLFSEFVPNEVPPLPIHFDETLVPVVTRINTVLPNEVIWELYACDESTQDEEKKLQIDFPYCRVDLELIICDNNLSLLKTMRTDEPRFDDLYQAASKSALKVMVWVQIGFQGLEELAKSPASRNWSTVGQFATDGEREQGIMTVGRKMYQTLLERFKNFRAQQKITDDYFHQYGIEWLLDSI